MNTQRISLRKTVSSNIFYFPNQDPVIIITESQRKRWRMTEIYEREKGRCQSDSVITVIYNNTLDAGMAI